MTEPTQLHALADGELAPQEANALRETLKSDPCAAAEVDAILNLKDLLAKNAVVHSDDEAWKGCLRRLDAIDKTRRVEGFVGRYAWAICGAMFLFILSGRVAMRNVQGDTARISDLLPFGRSTRPAGEQARLQARVYREILGRVRNGLDAKAIEVGMPVAGRVHDRPALRIPMRDGEGDLVLTRVQGLLNLQDTTPMPTNPEMAMGVVGGENCLVWRAGDETWVLNGARSLNSLGDVAARIVAH